MSKDSPIVGRHSAYPSAETDTFGLTKLEVFSVMLLQGLISGKELNADNETYCELAASAVRLAETLMDALNEVRD